MELCALSPWLVRPANVSDCTVTVCGSHVKRVSTRSDCTDLDAPARSNSDMQRNNEARTPTQANAKPRHLTLSDVGEQTQNVSDKALKSHIPLKTGPLVR